MYKNKNMIKESELGLKDTIFLLLDSNSDGKLSEYLQEQSNNNIYIPIWEYFDDSNNSILSKIIFNDLNNDFEYVFNYIKTNINDQKKFTDYINNKNKLGYSSIFYASYKGNIKVISKLIKFNANFRDVSKKGLNVLHLAAQGNKTNSLVYFKEKYNFDIESKDDSFSTALHWACYFGSKNVVEFLLSWNANVNIQDKNGNTPLHLAILSKNEKIIKKLLRNGANPKIKNNNGEIPLDLAKNLKNKKIINILTGKTYCFKCIIIQTPTKKIEKSILNIIYFFIIYFIQILGFLIFLLPIINEIDFYIFINSIFIVFLIYFILLCKNSKFNPIDYQNETNLLKIVENGENINDYCPKCLIKKKKFTVHCFICDVCIEDFDHHCYWINKCVGEKNYKIFILFLVVNLIAIIFYLYLDFIYVQKDYDLNDIKIIDKIKFLKIIYEKNYIKIVYFCVNIFLCLLFGIFLLMLIFIQFKNFVHNLKLYKKNDNNNNIDFEDEENTKRLLNDENENECNL